MFKNILRGSQPNYPQLFFGRRINLALFVCQHFSVVSPLVNSQEKVPVLLLRIEKEIQEAGGSRLMEACSLIKILTLYFSISKGLSFEKDYGLNERSATSKKLFEIEEIIQDAYAFINETYAMQGDSIFSDARKAGSELTQKNFGELVFALEELLNSASNTFLSLKDDKNLEEKARILFENEIKNKIIPFFKFKEGDTKPYIRELLKILKLASKKGWYLGELPNYKVGLILLGTPLKTLFSSLEEALQDAITSKENITLFFGRLKDFILEENKISKAVIEATTEELDSLIKILNVADNIYKNDERETLFWKEIRARICLYNISRVSCDRSSQGLKLQLDVKECEENVSFINKLGILSKPTALNFSQCLETLKKTSNKLFHFYFSFLETNSEQLLFEVLLTSLFKKKNHHIIPLRFINFIQAHMMNHPEQYSLKLQVFLAGKSLEVNRLNLKYLQHLEALIMQANPEALELTTVSKFSWICIMFGINDSKVFPKFIELMQKRFQSLESQNKWFKDNEFTASFFWSLENSTHTPSLSFYKIFFSHIKNSGMLALAPISDFSTICYSMSCFYVSNLESSTKLKLIDELALYVEKYLLDNLPKFLEKGELNSSKVGAIDFNKIFQFILTRKFLVPSQAIEKLHSSFENYWKEKQLSKFYEYSTTNNLEIDVGAVLKKMGIPYQEEVMISIYRVDFLLNNNIIMEIFGPKHYTRFSKVSKPRDNIKKFHLEKMGYKYIEVPVHDFKGIFFSRGDKRMEFILSKLGMKAEEITTRT